MGTLARAILDWTVGLGNLAERSWKSVYWLRELKNTYLQAVSIKFVFALITIARCVEMGRLN